MNRTNVDRTKLLQVALTLAMVGGLALVAGSIVSGPDPAEQRTAAVDPGRAPAPERPAAPSAP